jgi:DNA primase
MGLHLYRSVGSVTVRCPLPSHGHFDRSPSLRLHLDDGIFHCFGCGRTGDVVEWVCQTEGVGWSEAVRLLDSGRRLTTAWSGPEAVRGDRGADTRAEVPRDRTLVARGRQVEYPDLSRTPAPAVFDVLAAAWQYYSYGRLHDRGATYLATRGIDVSLLEGHTGRAEVGDAPTSPDGLVTAMQAKGFTPDELVDSGLAHRRGDGRVADFYRQRVLIPIRDQHSRICGFVGRNVGDDRWPKYKNPPRTHAYDKSVNLYQPLPAPAARGLGQVVVVEGTLDAMAIAVAAIRSGRAAQFCPLIQSGRELSSRQLGYVLNLHGTPPVIGFDGDAPGRESSLRVALAAAHKGSEVMVTSLPDGDDPATWLAKQGCAGLTAFVRQGSMKTRAGELRPLHVGCFLAETAARDGVDAAVARKTLAKVGVRLDTEDGRRRFAQQARPVPLPRNPKSGAPLTGTLASGAEASRTAGPGMLASERTAVEMAI